MDKNVSNNDKNLEKALSYFNSIIKYNAMFDDENITSAYSVEEIRDFENDFLKTELKLLDVLKNYSKEKELSMSALYSDVIFNKVSPENTELLYYLFCKSASFESEKDEKVSLIFYISVCYWNNINAINNNLNSKFIPNSNNEIKNSIVNAFISYLSRNKMVDVSVKVLDPLHAEIFDQVVLKNKLNNLNWGTTVPEEDYNSAKFVAMDDNSSYQNVIIPVVFEIEKEDYGRFLDIDSFIDIKSLCEIMVDENLISVNANLSNFIDLGNIVELNNKSKFYFWLKGCLNINLEENNFESREGFLHFILDENKNPVYAHASLELRRDGIVVAKLKAGVDILNIEDMNELIQNWNYYILSQNTMYYDALTITYGTKDDLSEEDYKNLFNYLETIKNKKITIN